MTLTQYVVDVDECATNSHTCSALATCHNTEGSYYCTCIPDCVGDGFTCAGNIHHYHHHHHHHHHIFAQSINSNKE